MKKLLIAITCIVGLSIASYSAEKEVNVFDTPSVSLTLAGSGVTATTVSDTVYGTTVGVSYNGFFGFNPVEVGVRQSVGYASASNTVVGTTAVFVDYNLRLWKQLYGFGGVSGGVGYGVGSPTWTFAPEAGLKYFVKKDVYLYGRASYALTENASNAIGYDLGVGVKF